MKDDNNETKTTVLNRFLGWLRYWTSDWGGKLTAFFALLTVGHILYLCFHWGGTENVKTVNNILLIIIYAGSFPVMLRVAKHPALPARTRRGWFFIALAYLFALVGNVLWAYFEMVMKETPFPSWADAFYLIYYPLMLPGLLLLAPRLQTLEERAKLILDAGIVTLGGGMLIWFFILEPIARAGSDDRLMTALSLAYPVSDLVLLFGVTVLLLRRTSSGNRGAINYLLTGILLFFFADLLFGYQNLKGTYQSGTFADSLYGIASLAAVISGHYQYVKAEQSVNQPEISPDKKTRTFSWLPYLGVAAGYAMLLKFVFEQPGAVLSQLIVIATFLTLFVVSRQVLAMRETEKAHVALGELHERFQGIYNASKDAIGFSDFGGNLIDVNDAYTDLTGYTKEELLDGKTFHQLTPPEYHQGDLEAVNKIIEFNQPAELEKEFIRKDGSRVPVSVTAYSVKGNDGSPIGLAAIIRDITERKAAEEQLKVFNRKLQQSNRELQDFAYVASHDLQEPLRKVQAFADRLGSKYADRLDETGLDYLQRMRNAAGRMQTLIQDLLAFSRVTTKAQPFAAVDLEKIAREVLSDLEVKIEETGAQVEVEDLPTVEADPVQMRQLIQNLVGNAIKFHPKNVTPVIRVSAQTNGNGNGANGTNNHYCKITVKDNGIGFEEKYLEKIFTVFQRLHGRSEYEGSGVGLAVCRKIVERHHGTITAKSTPGKGASFIISLPFKQPDSEVNQ